MGKSLQLRCVFNAKAKLNWKNNLIEKQKSMKTLFILDV